MPKQLGAEIKPIRKVDLVKLDKKARDRVVDVAIEAGLVGRGSRNKLQVRPIRPFDDFDEDKSYCDDGWSSSANENYFQKSLTTDGWQTLVNATSWHDGHECVVKFYGFLIANTNLIHTAMRFSKGTGSGTNVQKKLTEFRYEPLYYKEGRQVVLPKEKEKLEFDVTGRYHFIWETYIVNGGGTVHIIPLGYVAEKKG